jgi:biotin synthase
MVDSQPISSAEAEVLLAAEGGDFYTLLARAGAVREERKGRRVQLCGIINAKSGRCPENCAFCAQSAHHQTEASVYPLVSAAEMVERAHAVEAMGAREYSIVTSGTSIRSEAEICEICTALERLRGEGRLLRCASLGNIDERTFARLAAAGLTNYHHNLETARSFFPEVCTTHDYDDDVETVRSAKRAGLRVCCGGIFGMGESPAQRVELAETLRELAVDSIPLNFLNPIDGTPLEGPLALTPLDCLKIIAVFRLMMPDIDIFVCGGRERNLGDMQSWIFMAGANGMMVGDYLTTSGRAAAFDRAMVLGQGLEIAAAGDAAGATSGADAGGNR